VATDRGLQSLAAAKEIDGAGLAVVLAKMPQSRRSAAGNAIQATTKLFSGRFLFQPNWSEYHWGGARALDVSIPCGA